MIGLEHLADGSISDRNFQKLRILVPDTGGRSVDIRFGVASVTFTASTISATNTFAHGLGRTPYVVLGSRDALAKPGCFARDDTNLSFNAEYSASHTGEVLIDWVAIG
jgi:hypothetical protein